MPDELGIAKAHCQYCFNLLARFLILAVHVKGPGVGIQRIDIVPAGKLSLCDFERLKRFVSIVPIIKDQLAIRVVAAIGLEEWFLLEFSESFLGILTSSPKLQRFCQVKQIFVVRSRLITL